jgi:hypothetical protein
MEKGERVMLRVMIITFGVLGWSWYELSGGSEFQAGDRGVQLLASVKSAEPEPGAEAAPVVLAEVTRGDLAASDLTAITPMRVTADLPAPARRVAARSAEPVLPADPRKFAALLDQRRPLPAGVHLASAVTGEERAEMVASSNATSAEPETAKPDAPEADLRVVTGSRVNLRGGPSTGHAVLTQLLQGEHVEVLEDDGIGWVRLRALDDDSTGWMSADYLVASN